MHRETISKVINTTECCSEQIESDTVEACNKEPPLTQTSDLNKVDNGCVEKKQKLKTSESHQIGDLITSIVNSRPSGKTIVRLKFEFND